MSVKDEKRTTNSHSLNKENHMKTRGFSKWAFWLTIALLLGAAALLAGCGASATPCPECPEVDCPDCPEVECPECPECPEPVVAAVPFEAAWAASPHNDVESEAFRHWDEDDPAEVSASCAKCHSTPGYLDFLGVDGTEAGTVDNGAELGSTVECVACHNEATIMMTSVVFPSGMEVTGLGDESRCIQCHQGRASTVSVNSAIEEAGVGDDDVSEELGFINIHYYAAGATMYGAWAMGGYQYEGKTYDVKFAHVEGIDTCDSCHNPHSLEIRIESCGACHEGVASTEDLKNVRLLGSTKDYDGDGDTDEGVYYEIEGLQEILYQAIQAYASDAGVGIVYDAQSHPYWFTEDGERYAAWTPRLLKATYNYQTSVKDPGAFAHGGKYIIQLLYDSIEDLDASLVAGLHRIDAGHFAGSQEAWRHWDEDGEVQAGCAKCHSATGLPTYLKEGVNVAEPLANGLLCTTCHDAVPGFTRYEVGAVEFPSGAELDTGNSDSNLCLNCHQGRESTVSVNRVIAGLDVDTVAEGLGFRNVHYFAAGATLFGTDAKGAYEYEGQTYNGRLVHVAGFDSCIGCHSAHDLEVKSEACVTCHAGVEDVEDIRMDATDFDGDGDTTEGIAGEVETVYEALYAAIQTYAADTVGTPIEYNPLSYPYWFTADGERYSTWTPRLLQATYNYQYVTKDPGAFAHNGKYTLQVLYDSLADVGGDTTGMVRPELVGQ
jgi:hypothetical protein